MTLSWEKTKHFWSNYVKHIFGLKHMFAAMYPSIRLPVYPPIGLSGSIRHSVYPVHLSTQANRIQFNQIYLSSVLSHDMSSRILLSKAKSSTIPVVL